jgi:hypothetical protein
MGLREGEVDSMWRKLGFEVTNKKDVVARLVVHGRLVAHTKRSHGARKLDGRIQHLIRGQMFLSAGQFEEAIRCPLKADGYLKILKEKGKIE